MADLKFRTHYPNWQPQYPAYKEALSNSSPDSWYRQEPARFLPIFDEDYPEAPLGAMNPDTQRQIREYRDSGTPIEGAYERSGKIYLEGHPEKMKIKPSYKYGPIHEYRHKMTNDNPSFYNPNPPKEVLNELRALLKRFGTSGLEKYDSFDPSALYDEYMAFLTEHAASKRKMPPNIVQQNPFLMEIMMRGAPSNIWHGQHNPDPLTKNDWHGQSSLSEMPPVYVDPTGKYRIPLGQQGVLSQAFDPEGAGYDYGLAKSSGMSPGPDRHWGSVAPVPPDQAKALGLPDEAYVMLKGKTHETWDKAVQGEKARGFKIIKIGNRYYSVPHKK